MSAASPNESIKSHQATTNDERWYTLVWRPSGSHQSTNWNTLQMILKCSEPYICPNLQKQYWMPAVYQLTFT